MKEHLGGTAADLRRAFDGSFAEPRAAGAAERSSLLAIRVGGEPYAVRLAELAGLHADRTVVPAPRPIGGLIGLVSLRGTVAPVYDLAVLLGHPAQPAPRWLFLVRAGPHGVIRLDPASGSRGDLADRGVDPIAFAFERLEGQIDVAPGDLARAAESEHVSAAARLPDGVRALLDTGSLCAAIARGTPSTGKKED